MAGQKVDAQRDIIAELPHVWAVLSDVQRLPKVLRAVEAVERSVVEPLQVGSAWRERRRFLGKMEDAERTVTAMEAGKRLVIECDVDGSHYITDYVLQPSSLGTRLRVEFTSEASDSSSLQRAAWAVLGKMGARATKAALDEDLEDFAVAAESLANKR